MTDTPTVTDTTSNDGFVPPTAEELAALETPVVDDDGLFTEQNASQDADAPAKSDTVTVQVNGKKMDVPLADLVKNYQIGQAADERLALAKQAEARYKSDLAGVESLISIIKAGDIESLGGIFKHLGANFDELALKHATALLEQEMLPADKKALLAEQKRAAGLQRELEQRRDAEQKQQMGLAEQTALAYINEVMPVAMKDVGLPNTSRTTRRVADVWNQALQEGRFAEAKSKDDYFVQAHAVSQYVLKEYREEQEREFAEIDSETLVQKLGPRMREITKLLDSKKPKPVARRAALSNGASTSTKTDSPRYVGASEWRRQRNY